MNEFKENYNEIPQTQEFSSVPEYPNYSFEDLMNEANTFISDTNDFINGLTTESKEVVNVREYGLQDCTDAAKGIFTSEVLTEWGRMNVMERNHFVQEYAKAIGEGLHINFKGIIFERMADNVFGHNSGDGYIHLNENFLKNPSQVIKLIDTIAHEARHQFQREAIQNPRKFGIDGSTVKEWTVGLQNYSTRYATVYDPWGYFYNPVEMDARYFGESVVRGLTKDLINRDNTKTASQTEESLDSTFSQTTFSASNVSNWDVISIKQAHEDAEKYKKQMNEAINKGDSDKAKMYEDWVKQAEKEENMRKGFIERDMKK